MQDIFRRQSLDARRALSESYRATASAAVCRQLIRSRRFQRANTIGVYLSSADEVSLDSLISIAWAAGKRVFAPRITRQHEMAFCLLQPDSSLARNRFGIWEPTNAPIIAVQRIDWVIVPVAAFDDALHRIGMGGGFYDRAFAFKRTRHRTLPPVLTGVAYECQRCAAFAPNPWDIGVSDVVTESGSAHRRA